MPSVYRRGVTLSQALLEAAAVAPVNRAMLFCYELYHPSLGSPFRFVDNKSAFSATLEATAPFNAGEVVSFMALPVTTQHPEESDTADTPEVALAADNVSGVLAQVLRVSRGSLVPWTIIERLYASDQPSVLAKSPPMKYELTGADITATQAQLKASYGDPVNVSVPRLTFKREEYPGLQI